MPTGTPHTAKALKRIELVSRQEEDNGRFVERIARFVEHPDPAVREAVGLALINRPHPYAVGVIERGLNDSNRGVRETFARAAAENKARGLTDKIGELFRATHPFSEDTRGILAQALGELGHKPEHLGYLTPKEGEADEARSAIEEARKQIVKRIKERATQAVAPEPRETPLPEAEAHAAILKLLGSAGLRHANPAVRSKAAHNLFEFADALPRGHPLNRVLKMFNPVKNPRETGDLYMRGTRAGTPWHPGDWTAAAALLKKGKRPAPKRR